MLDIIVKEWIIIKMVKIIPESAILEVLFLKIVRKSVNNLAEKIFLYVLFLLIYSGFITTCVYSYLFIKPG